MNLVSTRRRRPTLRRNHAVVVLALLVILQQQLIFLAGTSAIAASASAAADLSTIDNDDNEPDAYDAATAAVTTDGAVDDNHDTPMVVDSVGGNNNNEGDATVVIAAHDVEGTATAGGATAEAEADEVGEVVMTETSITSTSSPTDNIVADDEQILGEDTSISSSDEIPNIVTAVVDVPNAYADSAIGGSSQVDGLEMTNNDETNRNNNIVEMVQNPPPTMHPTTSTTADAATTTTSSTTSSSSSDNPTIASTNLEDGNNILHSTTTTTTTTYERIMYNSLFQSNIMEYDMLKFDPFSFSGAPLGGWGRATRSRLATLPLRLAVGKDGSGGIPLMFGEVTGGGDSGGDGSGDGSRDEGEGTHAPTENEVVNDIANENKLMSRGESSSISSSVPSSSPISHFTHAMEGVRQSTGPHFTIHDATGQKYVCRVYAEDELIVRSRIDSVFNPAITIWDDVNDDVQHGEGGKSGNSGDIAKGSVDRGEDAKKPQQNSFHFDIKSSVVSVDDAANLPQIIRTSVVKLLRELRMNDAADELLEVDIDLDGEGVVLMMDDTIDGGDIIDGGDNDAAKMASELADIIKAAAVGAGMGSSKTEIDGGSKGAPLSSTKPPQLTIDQILHLIQSLKGTCSQFHDGGWWSYELCHLQQLRQFHVNFSNDAGEPKYDIRDVSLVGKFDGEIQIMYPTSERKGEFFKGSMTSLQVDDTGTAFNVRHDDIDLHADELYPDEIKNFDSAGGNLIEGAPVIIHKFDGGDFCEEVGYDRYSYNEMHCCTEDFIDRVLSASNRRKQNGDTPQAVLLSVQEVGPCIYRAKVCTPLLCPKPVTDSSTSDTETKPAVATVASTKTTTSSFAQQVTKDDPIAALLSAIFGKDTPDLGEIRVYFPDDLTGQEFDELIRQAKDGKDFTTDPTFQHVKEALRKVQNSKTMSIKDLLLDNDDDGTDKVSAGGGSGNDEVGGSIREILNKSLGTRKCLERDIGWWTYEFCYAKQIRQFHMSIDIRTKPPKQYIETEHILGIYKGSGNSLDDYPNEDERLHVSNAAGRSSSNDDDKNNMMAQPLSSSSHAGGNGAIYKQEYKFGEVCDHEDVAMSVIKGGNVLHGSIERSSTVRFMCGKRRELVDVKEDSTCHYILDVTVPELCHHELFRAEVTKSQVVKCLPV